MTIPLKPDHLAAAYECLRALPPLSAWQLPHADEVEFHVVRDRQNYGWHRYTNGVIQSTGRNAPPMRHAIYVSSWNVGYLNTLMHVMAHEMIHLYQSATGTDTSGVLHNAEFRRLQDQVSRTLGFDPKVLS